MVVECEVVVKLWERLVGIVGVWGSVVVERAEMAHGIGGTGHGTVVRNRLGFTLRSVVHRMRGLHVGGIEVTVDRLWSLFLRCLKKELVEEWYVARLEGNVALFASRVLIGGVLGTLTDGVVVWAPVFNGVGYRYWDLFD